MVEPLADETSALTGAGPSSQPAVCCEQVADAFTVPGAPLETPGSSNLHTQQQQASAFSQESLLKVAERQGHRLPETHEQQKKFLAKLTHLHLNGLQLQQLSSLKLCPQLQVLYLYDNQLTSISSLAGNRLITHLYLQNNQLQSLDGLQDLPLLHKLYVQNNQLSAISGLAAATRLEELHVSDQRLSCSDKVGSKVRPQQQQQQQQQQHSPEGAGAGAAAAADGEQGRAQCSSIAETGGLAFETATLQALSGSLKVLTASCCGIVDPQPLGMLHNLRSLDLSHNYISKIETFQPLLQGLQQLRSLDLRGNGCVQEAKYRDYVILLAANSLATLDGEQIAASHRAFLLRLHLNKLKAQARLEQQQQDKVQHSQRSHQQQQHEAGDVNIEQRRLQQREAETAATATSNKGSIPGMLEAAAGLADEVAVMGLSGTGVKLHPCKAPAARPPAVAGFNLNAVRVGAALGSAASHWIEQGSGQHGS